MADPSPFTLKLADLSFPLEPGRTYIVGKAATCDIRIGHGSVADRHCELAVGDAVIVVTDLDSAPGTRIDGSRIETMPWQPGQTLVLGEIQISLARTGYTIGTMPSEAPQRRRKEPSFADLMSDELKRAPWFALSAMIHAAVLLGLYYLWPLEEEHNPANRTIAMEQTEEEKEVEDEDDLPPEMITKELPDEDLQDLPVEMDLDEAPLEVLDDDETAAIGMDSSALMTRIRSGSGEDILKLGKGALSGGFKRTVSRLRQSGLEIVFVFDSTGSMGAVLDATKERISRMIDVLHALVPHSRIGIVTYRDHGDSEAYLTRSVPLSRNYYRSINFMQKIYAGGGADEPEAVYDGLKAAFTQKWQPNSRRLVILVGDAPPHKKSESNIQSLVRRFVHKGKSFVHAFVTSPNRSQRLTKRTQTAFKKIAKTGKGSCLDFEHEGKILKSVLSLAFGRDYKRSLDEVSRLVDKRNKKVSVFARELVKRADRDQLLKQFSRKPMRDDIVRAIIQSRSREIVLHLIDLLGTNKIPKHGRHAASYVVQTLLDVDEPPIDPERAAPISKRRARTLRKRAQRRL